MRYLVCLLFVLSFSLPVSGQVDYKEEKTKINSIKGIRYIYGEGIAETEEEALMQAEEALKKEIMILAQEKKSLKDADKIIVQAIKKNTSKIELKRGPSFRIFLYAEKNKIQNADYSMMMENPIKTESPKGTPEKEAATEEYLSAEIEKEIDTEIIPETKEEEKVSDSKIEISSPILRQIAASSSTSSTMELFARFKEEHKIMWGNVQTDIKSTWYILVCDGDKIIAVLDKGLNNRLNFLSGEKETLNKFSNYKKIWFIIYE